MNLHTKRRKRRRENSKLSNKNSVRKHKKKGGRTGGVFAKQPKGKGQYYKKQKPNPEPSRIFDLGMKEQE
jgi:hypothetical protein